MDLQNKTKEWRKKATLPTKRVPEHAEMLLLEKLQGFQVKLQFICQVIYFIAVCMKDCY